MAGNWSSASPPQGGSWLSTPGTKSSGAGWLPTGQGGSLASLRGYGASKPPPMDMAPPGTGGVGQPSVPDYSRGMGPGVGSQVYGSSPPRPTGMQVMREGAMPPMALPQIGDLGNRPSPDEIARARGMGGVGMTPPPGGIPYPPIVPDYSRGMGPGVGSQVRTEGGMGTAPPGMGIAPDPRAAEMMAQPGYDGGGMPMPSGYPGTAQAGKGGSMQPGPFIAPPRPGMAPPGGALVGQANALAMPPRPAPAGSLSAAMGVGADGAVPEAYRGMMGGSGLPQQPGGMPESAPPAAQAMQAAQMMQRMRAVQKMQQARGQQPGPMRAAPPTPGVTQMQRAAPAMPALPQERPPVMMPRLSPER